ncbi:MAG: hypothetical protein QW666_04500 [Candidatus Woesearchaeota archaeon]
MKITIDTGQDSHTDIKKAIRLLQSIVGDAEVYTNASRNIFDSPSPEVSQQSSEPANAFANMFDSAPGVSEKKEENKEKEFRLELY